jgi:hypothetical protein
MNSLKSYEQNPQALERYRAAKAFFNNGEFFRSYDLAREAFEALPEQLGLAHLAVLSLADAGAVEIALEKFGAFGLDRSRKPQVLVQPRQQGPSLRVAAPVQPKRPELLQRDLHRARVRKAQHR